MSGLLFGGGWRRRFGFVAAAVFGLFVLNGAGAVGLPAAQLPATETELSIVSDGLLTSDACLLYTSPSPRDS